MGSKAELYKMITGNRWWCCCSIESWNTIASSCQSYKSWPCWKNNCGEMGCHMQKWIGQIKNTVKNTMLKRPHRGNVKVQIGMCHYQRKRFIKNHFQTMHHQFVPMVKWLICYKVKTTYQKYVLKVLLQTWWTCWYVNGRFVLFLASCDVQSNCLADISWKTSSQKGTTGIVGTWIVIAQLHWEVFAYTEGKIQLLYYWTTELTKVVISEKNALHARAS